MMSFRIIGPSFIGSSTALMMTIVPAAAQQEPPRLAIEAGCHEIERLDPMKVITFKSCVDQEEDGLAKLKTQWLTFSAADRGRCVDLTRS